MGEHIETISAVISLFLCFAVLIGLTMFFLLKQERKEKEKQKRAEQRQAEKERAEKERIEQERQEMERRREEQLAQERMREVVLRISRKIPMVRQVNSRYSFLNVPSVVRLEKICHTKAEYDRFDYQAFLINTMKDQEAEYRQLIANAETNKEVFNRYWAEIKQILSITSDIDPEIYNRYPFFSSIQTRMIQERIKAPVMEFSVRIQKSYMSPKGQSSFSNSTTIAYQNVKNCFQEAQTILKNRQTREYQRKIMTDSLRYDVMKRDGFRCVLCGASAKEGAKLHVDHIIPVSRGGKTEMRNLRTLCEHCNFGKRDKYDPDGPN